MGRFYAELSMDKENENIRGVLKSFSNKDIVGEFPSYVNFKILLGQKSKMLRLKSLVVPKTVVKPNPSKNDLARLRQYVKETMKDLIDFASINFLKISLDRYFMGNLLTPFRNVCEISDSLAEAITTIYNEEVAKKYFNKVGETFIGDYDVIKNESIYSWCSRYVTPITLNSNIDDATSITTYLKGSKPLTYDKDDITTINGYTFITESPRKFLKIYSNATKDQEIREKQFLNRCDMLKNYKYKDGYPTLEMEKAFELLDAIFRDKSLSKKLVYVDDHSYVTIGLTIKPEFGTAELGICTKDSYLKTDVINTYTLEELLKFVRACHTLFVRIL